MVGRVMGDAADQRRRRIWLVDTGRRLRLGSGVGTQCVARNLPAVGPAG